MIKYMFGAFALMALTQAQDPSANSVIGQQNLRIDPSQISFDPNGNINGILISSAPNKSTPTLDVSPPAIRYCEKNQFPTSSGCWYSCDSPSYKQCPKYSFGVSQLLIYNNYCAYTKDGRYITSYQQCDACKDSKAIAVRQGTCSCNDVKCGENQYCLNGYCMADEKKVQPAKAQKCARLNCRPGYFCNGEKCQLNLCILKDCQRGFECKENKCVPIAKISNFSESTPKGISLANPSGQQQSIFGQFCGGKICPSGTYCMDSKCIPSKPSNILVDRNSQNQPQGLTQNIPIKQDSTFFNQGNLISQKNPASGSQIDQAKPIASGGNAILGGIQDFQGQQIWGGENAILGGSKSNTIAGNYNSLRN